MCLRSAYAILNNLSELHREPLNLKINEYMNLTVTSKASIKLFFRCQVISIPPDSFSSLDIHWCACFCGCVCGCVRVGVSVGVVVGTRVCSCENVFVCVCHVSVYMY